jgi:hypothetical protein
MTTIDAMGYLAASLVLATFCARTMVTLRTLALASNGAFIAYALAAHLWPILLLHTILLPLNLLRLREALGDLMGGTPTPMPAPVRVPARRR